MKLSIIIISCTIAAGAIAAAIGANLLQKTAYTLTGPCAFLPATRTTEFHGDVAGSRLNLAMAGNQWVVFSDVMRGFNKSIGLDPTWPAAKENDANGYTHFDLSNDANRYFIELIPPGQLRNQIKSGCMLLGNDKPRNFLPHNLQVDFDVFASTNYDLMQDLANNGFVSEVLPYIANRLDIMVVAGNRKGIGDAKLTDDTEFDTQFDIVMDLLSGDVTTSALDHINEGIHKAANSYMKKAHSYIIDNDRKINMAYTLANGTQITKNQLASAWVQAALAVVAKPMNGSPGQLRLISLDAGESHTSHALSANKCGVPRAYIFCEFALLNKRSTHETRIHHVETPNGLLKKHSFVPVDAGFVWVTELAYQLNSGNNLVSGISGTANLTALGIPNVAGVNEDHVYSIALLSTAKHPAEGQQFIDFVRGKKGQAIYSAGGFTSLNYEQLGKGLCFSRPVNGHSTATLRPAGGPCPAWF
jgi:ABC-type molybdate transport system substrate-binding protein